MANQNSMERKINMPGYFVNPAAATNARAA
jgi:hypothetical protein